MRGQLRGQLLMSNKQIRFLVSARTVARTVGRFFGVSLCFYKRTVRTGLPEEERLQDSSSGGTYQLSVRVISLGVPMKNRSLP